MIAIKEQKSALRKQMLLQRSAIEGSYKVKYDQYICHQLLECITNNNLKVVHAYLPMANEIDIAPLLDVLLLKQITVVSPKTLPKRQLENRILHSLHELQTGIKGTQHPATPDVYEGNYDLIIVPGLAFDAQKYRLGYGGGYYDNFLFSQPQAYKVGIFYPFQQVAAVPKEEHDICLDEILVSYVQ
ncbi:MAG TPA: 5-formyltetrahydrofolate cyclo-ligase [Bacteroidia bacterium]|nr:5-formyltetrahydrofolate cyclo-ligase [Bacteroidia bacterium]